MSILARTVLGILAGFIAGKLINKSSGGLVMDLAPGVVGAGVGGWLFNPFGSAGVTGFNLYGLFVAVIGAVVAPLIYRLGFRRARVQARRPTQGPETKGSPAAMPGPFRAGTVVGGEIGG